MIEAKRQVSHRGLQRTEEFPKRKPLQSSSVLCAKFQSGSGRQARLSLTLQGSPRTDLVIWFNLEIWSCSLKCAA
jgi:hypothetical protein